MLGARVDQTIRVVHRQWQSIRRNRTGTWDDKAGDALAWMHSDPYLELAQRSLEARVRVPLRRRGVRLGVIG